MRYLADYCTHFKLWSHIHLSTTVRSVTRDVSGRHTVTYAPNASGEERTWQCDAVAVCSGLHVTPNYPVIPGIENVPVRMHSSEFKARSQFGVGKTVMVLGSGETGADLAYLAVTAPTKQVVMCHRSGFHFAPRVREPFRDCHPFIHPKSECRADPKY